MWVFGITDRQTDRQMDRWIDSEIFRLQPHEFYMCHYFAYFTYITCLVRAQVDGKKVSTAEEAAAAILGDRGSTVHFLMQRDIEGKNLKFPLKLERDKPK